MLVDNARLDDVEMGSLLSPVGMGISDTMLKEEPRLKAFPGAHVDCS